LHSQSSLPVFQRTIIKIEDAKEEEKVDEDVC
jgi:hypothetical protein